MVDGIIGFLDRAVKLVVVEDGISLESVTDLNLRATEKTVMAQIIIFTQLNAITSAVLVRSYKYYGTNMYLGS